jgi:flavin-binding protein dodecin
MKSLATPAAMLVSGLLLIGCTSSAVESVSASASGCVRRARLALHDADFYRIKATDGSVNTVVAEHDGYKAELHCAAGSVNVSVTGPDSFQVDWYRDTILRKF